MLYFRACFKKKLELEPGIPFDAIDDLDLWPVPRRRGFEPFNLFDDTLQKGRK